MATRFINLDMLPGIELKDVKEAGSVLVKDDIFAMRDVVYIVARMDESAVGYKFGCVAKSRVKGTDKHVESGKIKILLDEIEECEPFNMGGIKEIGENYWYQKYLRMPAKVENKDIVDFMRETFKTNRSKLLNEGVGEDMVAKKETKAVEPKKVATAKKEETKAKTASTRTKRPSRAKKSTKVAEEKTQTELKLSDDSKVADVKEPVVAETAKEEPKKAEAAKKPATRSRKRTTTAKKSGTAKSRAGRTGGTGRATKRNTGDGKVTSLESRRTRKTVAEKAAEAKMVADEISRRAGRAGRTGATGNRSGGTATAERPKATTTKASSAKTSAAKSSETKTAAPRSTRVSVRDAVASENEALKSSESVPVVDTVSALTESKEPGSNVTVDVKNNKLEITMNFVMDRANFVEGELSQLNFFMEQVVSSMFKVKAVYEWTSEEEKQYIVESWIESIMADMRSDEAKAKRLVDYVKKSKKISEWEVGLVMRNMIAESLKSNENVHFVYEVRGLTDKQKDALEKLVKQNKLEVELHIA